MTVRATLALALADGQEILDLELPEGSTVADALEAARPLLDRMGGFSPPLRVGIWSRPCAPETPLRDGDRVEVYRPLKADPRQMRRARARLKPAKLSRGGR